MRPSIAPVPALPERSVALWARKASFHLRSVFSAAGEPGNGHDGMVASFFSAAARQVWRSVWW